MKSLGALALFMVGCAVVWAALGRMNNRIEDLTRRVEALEAERSVPVELFEDLEQLPQPQARKLGVVR